jgi:hypothetical protein
MIKVSKHPVHSPTIVYGEENERADLITLSEVKEIIKKYNIPPEYAALNLWLQFQVFSDGGTSFEKLLEYLKED